MILCSICAAEDIIITQQSAAARLRRIQHVKIKRSCLVMDKENFPQRDSNTGMSSRIAND